jgi:hypothetical protein
MAKTVAALMASLGEAQAAVRELVASGVRREDVGFMADEKHGIVVTVATADHAQAERAMAIIGRHGALDVDEREALFKKQGWKGRFDAGGA